MKLLLFALLVLPAVILTLDNGVRPLAKAEDELEDEIVDGEVESEGEELVATEEEDEGEGKSKTSPDAETVLLFTKPQTAGSGQMDLPVGQPVEFLVGFRNKGSQDFVVESIEASFRYPMDFSFYIQNFSAVAYNRLIKPTHEATFEYSFVPSEAFAGRPFGLSINLNYHDVGGNPFQEAVYNETVQIVEIEEGLDGETFFMYLFLATGVVLLLVVGQQFLTSLGRKRTTRKPVVETGTSNPNNVDYDWLPKQMLASLNKSPKQFKNGKVNSKMSPKQSFKQSPKQRKVTRKAGQSAEK